MVVQCFNDDCPILFVSLLHKLIQRSRESFFGYSLITAHAYAVRTIRMFRFAAYLVAVDTLVPMVSVVAFPFVRKGMVCCCNFFSFRRAAYRTSIGLFALCRAGRLSDNRAVIPSMRGFVFTSSTSSHSAPVQACQWSASLYAHCSE